MVDMHVSEACAVRCAGSSPAFGTGRYLRRHEKMIGNLPEQSEGPGLTELGPSFRSGRFHFIPTRLTAYAPVQYLPTAPSITSAQASIPPARLFTRAKPAPISRSRAWSERIP